MNYTPIIEIVYHFCLWGPMLFYSRLSMGWKLLPNAVHSEMSGSSTKITKSIYGRQSCHLLEIGPFQSIQFRGHRYPKKARMRIRILNQRIHLAHLPSFTSHLFSYWIFLVPDTFGFASWHLSFFSFFFFPFRLVWIQWVASNCFPWSWLNPLENTFWKFFVTLKTSRENEKILC